MAKSVPTQNSQMIESQRRFGSNGVTGWDLTQHEAFNEAEYWEEEFERMNDSENE